MHHPEFDIFLAYSKAKRHAEEIKRLSEQVHTEAQLFSVQGQCHALLGGSPVVDCQK